MAETPMIDGTDRIAVLAEQRAAALRDADAEALGRILHDRLIYIHSSATVDGKQSHIDSVTSGRIDYKSFDTSAVRFIEASPGTLLRNGRMKISLTVSGNPRQLHVAFIEAWLWNGDDWQLLSWQSTTIPEAK